MRLPLRLIVAITVLVLGVHALVADVAAQSPRTKVIIGHLLPEEGGTASDTPSPLKSPFGLDFEADGKMILVELEGGRVHRCSTDGMVETIAGNGQAGYEGDGELAQHAVFNGMHNVAVAKSGDIYISDTWNHCVRKINAATGKIETIAGTGEAGFAGDGGPAAQAKFDYVMCVTLDDQDHYLYLADTNNRRIRVVDLKTSKVKTIAGNGEKGEPKDGADATASPLIDPRAVAVDSKGQVYVLERSGNALRVVSPDGKISTVAGNGETGKEDGKGREARLLSPKHLCVDAQDNVYIADEGNHLIRKYDPRTTKLSTVLGEGRGTPPVVLKHPHGVCIEDGILYVVDSGNNRILRVEE